MIDTNWSHTCFLSSKKLEGEGEGSIVAVGVDETKLTRMVVEYAAQCKHLALVESSLMDHHFRYGTVLES